jgi:ABC-type branched-subunit amino acid transport system ATPase component
MALLVVDGLEKRFGGLPAVDGVTFGVDEGEILAVVGPNGAGKSTLLKTIGGLERPSAGTVTLAGERVDAAQHGQHEAEGQLGDRGRGHLGPAAKRDHDPAGGRRRLVQVVGVAAGLQH